MPYFRPLSKPMSEEFYRLNFKANDLSRINRFINNIILGKF